MLDPAAVLSALQNAEPSLRQQAVEVIYATAVECLSKESYAAAACVFRLMLRAAPTDERAWLGLGDSHVGLDHDRLALDFFGRGMVASYPSPRCTLARARTLRRLGEHHEALDALEQARELAVEAGDDEALALVARERSLQ